MQWKQLLIRQSAHPLNPNSNFYLNLWVKINCKRAKCSIGYYSIESEAIASDELKLNETSFDHNAVDAFVVHLLLENHQDLPEINVF